MRYLTQLVKLENQIVRLGELKKLYNVISNGAESSDKEQLISAIGYMEGSLEDIYQCLLKSHLELSDSLDTITVDDKE